MMRKIILLIIAALLLLSIAIWVIKTNTEKNNYRLKQEVLAEKLGVKIQDFPPEFYFPVGYFSAILKPGMSIGEVHNLVREYDKVLRCRYDVNFYDREIYYFYSDVDKYPLRFELFFDRQQKYERFQGEDRNSGSLMSDGCETGLIPIR
jgi:hypothetical protein